MSVKIYRNVIDVENRHLDKNFFNCGADRLFERDYNT